MSNRASSKQHGCHRIKRRTPSKKPRIKLNREKARERQQDRQQAIREALAAKA